MTNATQDNKVLTLTVTDEGILATVTIDGVAVLECTMTHAEYLDAVESTPQDDEEDEAIREADVDPA